MGPVTPVLNSDWNPVLDSTPRLLHPSLIMMETPAAEAPILWSFPEGPETPEGNSSKQRSKLSRASFIMASRLRDQWVPGLDGAPVP